jgi:signal peptidase I
VDVGDLVVGARSGREEPERPGEPDGREVPAEGSAAPGEPGFLPSDPAASGEGVHGPGGDEGDGAYGGSGEPGGSGGSDGSGEFEDDGGSGRDGSRRAVREERPPRSFWKELPLLIVVALVLALLIKTFLLQAFSIPSASMYNTLQVGDRVLVDKLTPWFGAKPKRGEVVVFHDPGGWLAESPGGSSNPVVAGFQKGLSFIGLMPSVNEKDLIKRVIAVGGDTVECKGTGPVIVNGKPLSEPYIYPGNTPCSDRPFGPVKVPKNDIWVMGDHRQDSSDSRYNQDKPTHGFVPDKDVVGRAVVVAWPINHWKTLPIPKTFSQPGLSAAAASVPAVGGLAGALPLVMWRRRRLIARVPRRSAEAAARG